jgi:hypothetical protein
VLEQFCRNSLIVNMKHIVLAEIGTIICTLMNYALFLYGQIIRMLMDFGIEKIDTVTVMQDPQNPELNRGFAFLDLETNRDAQLTYKKLKAGDFTKGGHVIIDWAEPWHEPDEEEMLKVLSPFYLCIVCMSVLPLACHDSFWVVLLSVGLFSVLHQLVTNFPI